jgi:LytS/YehU family sensor histidine kinase
LQDVLKLEVTDNGRGYTGLEKEGIGLSNVKARLKQLFAGRFYFELSSHIRAVFPPSFKSLLPAAS